MLIKLLRPIKKFAGKCIRLAYKLTYRLFKVDDKLVIFISFTAVAIQTIQRLFMNK